MKQLILLGAVIAIASLTGCTGSDTNSSDTSAGTIKDTNIPTLNTNVPADNNAMSGASGPTIKNTNIPTLNTSMPEDTNAVSGASGPTIKDTNIPTMNTNTNQ